ncbi:MAG: methyltransferase domain-containing protein [Patescibacteria group bacterium]|jgi:ubiquinone/menaquinone biosynthesis C-methylase UbiE
MLNKALKTNLLNIDLILEKAKISEGFKIGDLGCGRGGHFTFLSAEKVGKKGVVYAVDVMKNNLALITKEAKELNLPQITPVWSDIETYGGTKIDKESLDIIFLVNVLHESSKPLDIIKESLRLLKKSGKVVIADWKKISSPIGPELSARLNKETLISAVGKLGLSLEEEFEAGKYHFGLIFIKA